MRIFKRHISSTIKLLQHRHISSTIKLLQHRQGTSQELRIGAGAIRRLELLNAQTSPASTKYLRIEIDAGGCHGFQYKMKLTSDIQSDDIIFEADGQKVLTDELTLDMIKGSKLDWVEEMIEQSFQIVDNPNAESSCGCKVSFNIKAPPSSG